MCKNDATKDCLEALGGGGARGFAHLGVLKVLQEADIPIDALSGTSMGAVMAVLYAAGADLKYLTALAGNIAWEKFVDLRFPRYGLVEGKRITPLIRLLTKKQAPGRTGTSGPGGGDRSADR